MPHLALSLAINAVDSTLHFGFTCTKCGRFVNCFEMTFVDDAATEEAADYWRTLTLAGVLEGIASFDPDFAPTLTDHDFNRHEIPRQAALN